MTINPGNHRIIMKGVKSVRFFEQYDNSHVNDRIKWMEKLLEMKERELKKLRNNYELIMSAKPQERKEVLRYISLGGTKFD